MKNTLRFKIIAAFTIGILIIMTICTIVISKVMENNIEETIRKDMKPMVQYAKESINSLVQLEEQNTWGTVNRMNQLFNVYICFKGETSEAIGEIILKEDIEDYKLSEEKKDSLLKITTKDNVLAGTLLYPIYADSNYIGNIIIQKDYSNIYLANNRLLKTILITIAILSVILIIVMHFIIKNFTKPLEKLAIAMNNFGKGKDVSNIKVTSKDEVMVLAREFNNMKDNVIKLQNNSKEFFNNATHELKTPLTAIRGYAQMLQEEEFEDEFVQRAVVRLEEESIKMNKLVENLLIISREEARIKIEPEDISVNEILKNILRSFELRIETGEYNIIFRECEEIKLDAIKEDIETIFTNLIDNSLKYSKDKVIEIIIGNEENGAFFKINNKTIEITDEIKNNLLEPFTKGNIKDKEISSSGLGLYICKRLCEKNKIDIKYEIKESHIEFELIKV